MRRRLRAHNEADLRDEKDWLMTYADVVTLLLAFFVMIITVSSTDEAKVENLKEGIAVSVLKRDYIRSDFQQIQESLESILSELESKDVITINKTPLGIELELSNTLLYDSGSASLRSEAVPIINDIATTLTQFNSKHFLVEVDGHTDDLTISTTRYPSNWELSAARATNIVRLLIDNGVPANSLKAAGFADSRPKIGPNENGIFTPEQREVNRRAVILITK